ncbi:MAG TPA: phosphate signaling complex protein PhoU [Acidimicrobiales bacterium]|jgi:phosphate transport system protein|nr:phosphate signaling complex protein PhoU [Acidimicrobiales bacterium]
MTETRTYFHDQLRHVKSDVVRLAALAGESIPRSTEALLTADHDALARLRVDDGHIDRLAAAIESDGCRLLALQQPVAGDLRALVTALRLAYELERIGDLMVDVASTIDGPRREIDGRARGLVEQLGELTHALLRGAIDAYVDGEEAAGARLRPILQEVVEVHHRLLEHLLSSARDGGLDVDAAVQFALVGRCFERAADHAFNVVRRVHYLVAGSEPGTQRGVTIG